MQLLCPHCNNPIELVHLPPSREVVCNSCGSTFRLETDSTRTWPAQGDRRVLDRFELVAAVGIGAFGTVYKARDPQLDRTVAIKVPRSGNLSSPEDRSRFLREARSIAQLRHPAIVPVHEVGQHDGLPYLVSDFVQGVTLSDLMTSRRPTFREAAELIAEVADALQYAHDQRVIHRDVKPSNIMLDDRGKPFLMDFGVAKRDAGEITMTLDGQILGTPAYMSPEQARGEGHRVDGRTDVYSLGVILYELLTGQLPFRGNSRMLLHQVLYDEPKLPRKLDGRIPRDLETICSKAMAKETARRYASSHELAEDLRRFLEGRPILARPVGRLERLWRWSRRNPTVACLTATVAVLFVVVAILAARLIIVRQLRDDHSGPTPEQHVADSPAITLGQQLRDGDIEFKPGLGPVSVTFQQSFKNLDRKSFKNLDRRRFGDQFNHYPGRGYMHTNENLRYQIIITNRTNRLLQLWVQHGFEDEPPFQTETLLLHPGGTDSETIHGLVQSIDVPVRQPRKVKVEVRRDNAQGEILSTDTCTFYQLLPQQYMMAWARFEPSTRRLHVFVIHLESAPVTGPVDVTATVAGQSQRQTLWPGDGWNFWFPIHQPMEKVPWRVDVNLVPGVFQGEELIDTNIFK